MRLISLSGALALCLLAAWPGAARAKRSATPAAALPAASGVAAAEELATVWRDVCLDAFPTDDALTALAARSGFRVMTDVEASTYLRDVPGRGWFYRTPIADYAVLIQARTPDAAPSCSVRRMTPNGLPSGSAYFAARDRWAARHPGALQALDPQGGSLPGGAESEGIGSALVDPGGRTTDLFLAIVTEYHGLYHGHDAAAARGGPGVEVRLVHTLGPAA